MTAADDGRMKSKKDISLYGHLSLSALLQSRSLPVAIAFLTAENVAADTLVEHAKTVRHEVADVGEIQERERNAKQSIDDGNDTTQRSLWSNVTITYHNRYSYYHFPDADVVPLEQVCLLPYL